MFATKIRKPQALSDVNPQTSYPQTDRKTGSVPEASRAVVPSTPAATSAACRSEESSSWPKSLATSSRRAPGCRRFQTGFRVLSGFRYGLEPRASRAQGGSGSWHSSLASGGSGFGFKASRAQKGLFWGFGLVRVYVGWGPLIPNLTGFSSEAHSENT